MSVKFVKPEHVEIIREYLVDNSALVLVMPNVQDNVTSRGIEDGTPLSEIGEDGYDFGGESDVIIDIVSSDLHLFIQNLPIVR
jgi:hypothetical protein